MKVLGDLVLPPSVEMAYRPFPAALKAFRELEGNLASEVTRFVKTLDFVELMRASKTTHWGWKDAVLRTSARERICRRMLDGDLEIEGVTFPKDLRQLGRRMRTALGEARRVRHELWVAVDAFTRDLGSANCPEKLGNRYDGWAVVGWLREDIMKALKAGANVQLWKKPKATAAA